MYRTFNMGIGLAIVVRKNDASRFKKYLIKSHVRHYHIGEVVAQRAEKIIFKD